MTAKEREKSFRAALEALCEEHGAEMTLTDDGKPWGMHSPILEIHMPAVWENNEVVKEFTSFNY